MRFISMQRKQYRDPDHFLSLKALAVAVIMPHFVGALAGVAFLTGFWMVCK